MPAKQSKLVIVRGDSERLKALITPFTAAVSLRFMAKKRLSDSDGAALIDKSVGSGITIVDAGDADTPAEAQILIDPADTLALRNTDKKEVSLYYELEDGNDHRLDFGTLVVKPKVILDELEPAP